MKSQVIMAFVGPSGSGKTTLCRHLCGKFEDLNEVVSVTTRSPRPNEVEGIDYHFLTWEEALSLKRDGAFLECAEYDGNLYGMLRKSFVEPLRDGKSLAVVVERSGLRLLKQAFPDKVKSILVVPPDLNALRLRLENGQRDTNSIQRRLLTAEKEMTEDPREFDYIIVNDLLLETLTEASSLYRSLIGN
jgi:guanylate kinase